LHRILHIIDSIGRTGTAKQLLVLAKAQSQQGFDVHVCGLADAPNKVPLPFREGIGKCCSGRSAAVSFTGIGRRWPIDPLADWQLSSLVKRFQPDVIHTWDSVAGMFGAIATRKKNRGHHKLISGRYRMPRWTPTWESFWQNRFARCVDRFVTNSPTVRDWWLRRALPADRFAVISSGVAPARASHVSRDELLHELRLPADARLVGVVGTLVPEKNIQDLIWAADLLRVLHDNLRLLVIGDGPERQQLQRYARLASDLDHIQFLGERGDLCQIMPHLDVLWNGSENRGVSIAVLEAMAAGVPVVASDTPCNREPVVEGETGFLIPLGSRAGRAARAGCSDRIFTDAELANRMSSASRQRVAECFDAERMIRIYHDLYQAMGS
jgi:glycosyltransferase involved in cell wall biosynthesis